MARLSEQEKQQILQATRQRSSASQPKKLLPSKEYFEFLEFVNKFLLQEKPVNFSGQHWKL
jgi:hypothetical protein